MVEQVTLEKRRLVAACPNCRAQTLSSLRSRENQIENKNQEVLFCTSCRLIVPVEDLKKYLWTV